MVAGPKAMWLDARTGKSVGGLTIPSNSPVLLDLRHHLEPPVEYVIYRILPKVFWKFWSANREEVARLEALEGLPSSPLGGRFYSEPLWNLPASPQEAGSATFQTWTDTGDAHSGQLGSARIRLKEMSATERAEASIGVSVSGPAVTFGPKVRAVRNAERHRTAQVADDPWMEVSVLQGEPVLAHLRLLEEQYQGDVLRPTRPFAAGLAATVRWYADHRAWWEPLTTQARLKTQAR